MISINATLFLQVLQFLILVWILNRFLFRPIFRLINDRDLHIEKVKQEAQRLENETTALIDKGVAMGREAWAAARNERYQLEHEAFAESERIFEDTRQKIDKIRVETEKEIDKQVEKARDNLRGEAALIADEIIEKVIGRRVEA